jgi:hypothetical protein
VKSVRILQIGDVHFPDAHLETLGDLKDAAYPAKVIDKMRLTPLTCVVRALEAEMEKSVNALLFCGDITSFGDVAGYRACLAYLSDILRLKKWNRRKVHAVPGNHDVERGKTDAPGTDLFAKFAEFKRAWEDVNLPILTVDAARITDLIVSKTVRAKLLSLNSSVGCGEKRHLPSDIQSQLADLLDAYVSTVGLSKAFEVVGEKLDSPGFLQTDIERVCAELDALDETVMAVVLSHHNILPQARLRVQIYTEVMNAGMIRSRLSRMNRPVLYCHGHIHDNPVELVQQIPLSTARLICVVAPELSRGFNVLQIDYGHRGYPLGCRLYQHQLQLRDGAVTRSEIRIPFYTPDQLAVRRLGHPRLPLVLSRLPDHDIRFDDIVEAVGSSGPPISAAQVSEVLLEGEWLGFVELSNRDFAAQEWIIRKVVR